MHSILHTLLIAGCCYLCAEGQPEGKTTMINKECVLQLEPGPGNPRNSEGSFIQLKGGRILFIYTHFTGSAGDDGAAFLASRFSDDGGHTWSKKDEVGVENEGGQNVMSVSLLRRADGRIMLLYLRKNSSSDCRPYVRFSTDEATTWSEPHLCIDRLGYYVVNNDRVIQLKNGRILIPASRHSLDGEPFHGRGTALCYYSDDNGVTWHKSASELEAPPESHTGLQEPGVVELADGSLLMFSRTDMGCQYESRSSDGGNTWTPAVPSPLLSPTSPMTCKRIPGSATLLVVWNDHEGIAPELKNKRTPLALAISRDNGKSWIKKGLLETDPKGWYCYTAMNFYDSHVLLGYCAGDPVVGGLNRLRVVRVPLKAITGE